MTRKFQFVFDNGYDSVLIDRLCDEMKGDGLDFTSEVRPNLGPTASITWLVLTGIVVYLVKPYTDGFLTKAGEDHYEILKRVVSERIWPKVLGQERTLEKQIVTLNGQIKDDVFSSSFSLSYPLSAKGIDFEVRLLFPTNTSKKGMDTAVHLFLSTLKDLEERGAIGDLAEKLLELDEGRKWAKLVWYNEESGEIELLDPIKSSREKRLVSYRIK